MGFLDFMKSKPSDEDLQSEANAKLAAADLSQFKTIPTRLVGVTSHDPDGPSRQEIISQLKPGDALQIKQYRHKGTEIMAVTTASGQVAGLLSAVLTERLIDEYNNAPILAAVKEITHDEPESELGLGCLVDLFIA